MKRLREDLELDDVINLTFSDAYEQWGADMFSDEHLQTLKDNDIINRNGDIIDVHNGYYDDEVQTEEMSLADLRSWDYNFITQPFIQQLVLDRIKDTLLSNYSYFKKDDANGFYYYDFTVDNLENLHNFRRDYLEAVFSENTIDVFWDNDFDYHFSDIDSNTLENIPQSVKDTFKKYGIPENIIEQLANGEADDEAPYAEYYDDIIDAVARAYNEAMEYGAAEDCENDFNTAFENSMPDGCVWDKNNSDCDTRRILISEDFFKEYLERFWDELNSYSDSIRDCIEYVFLDLINQSLEDNFDEPYAGWYGFADWVFNDRLDDLIDEIDFKEPEPQEEADILKFDGETGEYKED